MCLLSAVSKRTGPPGGCCGWEQGQVELQQGAGACREPLHPQPEEPAVCCRWHCRFLSNREGIWKAGIHSESQNELSLQV